jgi:hypothetical protein
MTYLDFRSLCLIISMQRVGWARAGTWSRKAVNLRPQSLIGAMRRVGGGADRHLVPYSHRFTLTEPQRRHAAWRHLRRGRGGGGAGGGGESTGGEGGEV